jgi:hypothetical protein
MKGNLFNIFTSDLLSSESDVDKSEEESSAFIVQVKLPLCSLIWEG